MLSLFGQGRILSDPIEVLFMGFRSDTYAMQRSGWRLAAHEEPYHGTVRLAAELDVGRNIRAIRMISDPLNVDFFSWTRRNEFSENGMAFNMHHIANDFIATVPFSLDKFVPIDAEPQFEQEHQQPKRMSEMHIFARPQVREEIIVEPSSVAECLDIIRKLQAPDLARIRERNRMRENAALNAPVFHAQILSLAA